MSLDYPDRKVWLAIRENRNLERMPRYLRVMPATGKTKDPGRTHAQRRRKGPLLVATGPGSINAESEMRALVVAGKFKEAAEFYESCHRVFYKHGKPKMRWGGRWYLEYKRTAGIAA